jgi:ribosome-associated heat shock protein Hsp15
VNQLNDQQQMVRIDKWLWAVRVYKTRTQATDACRGGHVKINGQNVKPSHEVRPGEVITAQLGPVTKTIKVLGLIEQRVGAAIAKLHAEDLTPPAEYEKAREPVQVPYMFRPKGQGRPTKKDRRAWERLGTDQV